MPRNRVLRLYKKCLKSAAKCPTHEHRLTMKRYVQLSFKENAVQIAKDNHQQIEQLLARGQQEYDSMEYYHSLYAAKQREQQAKQPMRNDGQEKPQSCLNCGQDFQSPQANFCANCGVQRPTAT